MLTAHWLAVLEGKDDMPEEVIGGTTAEIIAAAVLMDVMFREYAGRGGGNPYPGNGDFISDFAKFTDENWHRLPEIIGEAATTIATLVKGQHSAERRLVLPPQPPAQPSSWDLMGMYRASLAGSIGRKFATHYPE
jgi:hypothetical protein